MDLALTLAARSLDARRYEDLKIVFFSPSQERLLRLRALEIGLRGT
jgi:hypothetical protein